MVETIAMRLLPVRALGVRVALDDDPPRLLPGTDLVVKAGEEPLRITRFVAFSHFFLP